MPHKSGRKDYPSKPGHPKRGLDYKMARKLEPGTAVRKEEFESFGKGKRKPKGPMTMPETRKKLESMLPGKRKRMPFPSKDK